MRYVTLDDATQLAAASSDAQGFLAGLGARVVIDEVQKAPALFPAIKMAVDQDRRPGRFLLTGSANVLFLPQILESLTGRMELINRCISISIKYCANYRKIDAIRAQELMQRINYPAASYLATRKRGIALFQSMQKT